MNGTLTPAANASAACTIKDLPIEERPRERLFAHGAERLTDAELVGILLGSGIRGATAVDLARRLVARFGGLRGLARPAATEIAELPGIGEARAARLCACLELGRRCAALPLAPGRTIDGPGSVERHFGPLLADARRERLYVVLLDRKNRVIREHLVAEGTVDEAAVHPRDVYLPAVRESASSVLLVHNHPSGDPSPSDADWRITSRLILAGRAIGIRLLDHVVVGGGKSVSLAAERGGSIESICPDISFDAIFEPAPRYVARPLRRARSP
jgi:DNA repair protein RadC